MFDAIYCINLPNRHDRKEHVLQQFAKHKINNVIFDVPVCRKYYADEILRIFPAFINHFNDSDNRFKSELACAISHFNIWKHAFNNKYNRIIIFEDDVLLDDDFTKKLNHYFLQVPYDWKLIYLGGTDIPASYMEGINPGLNYSKINISKNVERVKYTLALEGYAINIRYSMYLYHKYIHETNTFISKCDEFHFYDYELSKSIAIDTFFAKLQQTEMMYQFNPKLTSQIQSRSDIQLNKLD